MKARETNDELDAVGSYEETHREQRAGTENQDKRNQDATRLDRSVEPERRRNDPGSSRGDQAAIGARMNKQQRKPPARRLFTGMAGSPLAHTMPKSALAAKPALGPEPTPVVLPKKPGRPRVHQDNAAKQDAYRQKKVQVSQLRDVFGAIANDLYSNTAQITTDEFQAVLSEISKREPRLASEIAKLKADLEHKTEIELAKAIADLKPYVPKTESAQFSINRGKYMPEAPKGKGAIIYGHDFQQEHVRIEDTNGFGTKSCDVGAGDEQETSQINRTPIAGQNREEQRTVIRLDTPDRPPTVDMTMDGIKLALFNLIPPGVAIPAATVVVLAFLQISGITVSRFRELPESEQRRIRAECWEIARK